MYRWVNAVLAGAIALSFPVAVAAADLGRGRSLKDPPPPPREEYAEPFYNWQGLYAGAFVGGGSEDGVAVGGWIGYNFMLSSRFVVGVEADVGKANADQSDESDLTRATIDTFGSVRGRYGYAIDRFLIYGTAGLAFANVTNAGEEFGDDKMKTGYAVGGGLEYAFTPNLIARAEYIYSDYGNVSLNRGNDVTEVTSDMHLARIGLSYRF